MRRALVILVAALVLAIPATAAADIDPPSDVLLFQNQYFPRANPPSDSLKATLAALTGEANKAGYHIRVAVIGSRIDLGGAPQVWRHPDQYAKFLGIELQSATGLIQPLLVVMPGGIGLNAVGPGGKAVSNMSVPRTADSSELMRAAITATQRLSAGAGHPLAAPSAHTVAKAAKKSHSGGAPLLAFMLPALLLVAVGILLARGRSRRAA